MEPDSRVLSAFLSFLDRQMTERPDLIRPFTAADIEVVAELVLDVEVDLDEEIDDDFVLP